MICMNKFSIVFLVSSNGGLLKFLNEYFLEYEISNFQIKGVIGDRECNAINYASSCGIYNKVIKYNKNNRTEIFDELKKLRPDLIITNIFKILDRNIVSFFKGKLINFHFSLLPAFKGIIGISTIEEAKKLKCQFIGSTCHYVDEEVDNGTIISQCIFQISNKDNDSQLSSVMFRANCLLAINTILNINNLDYTSPTLTLLLKKQVMFSPAIDLKYPIPNETFWGLIKDL